MTKLGFSNHRDKVGHSKHPASNSTPTCIGADSLRQPFEANGDRPPFRVRLPLGYHPHTRPSQSHAPQPREWHLRPSDGTDRLRCPKCRSSNWEGQASGTSRRQYFHTNDMLRVVIKFSSIFRLARRCCINSLATAHLRLAPPQSQIIHQAECAEAYCAAAERPRKAVSVAECL